MELLIHSPNQKTIVERRMEMLNRGQRIEATPYTMGGVGVSRSESVGVSTMNMAGYLPNGGIAEINNASLFNQIPQEHLRGGVGVRTLMSGFDIPMAALGNRTLNDVLLESGLSMEGNSLVPNWESLWDAMRIDLTIRKLSRPTVREFIYDVRDTPNATRTMTPQEMFSHYLVFKENNGTGQSVHQGEIRAGQYDTMTQKIYAAGLLIDLMTVLFGRNYTDTSVNDAVAIGEAGLKDELALAPIFAYSYSGAQQTAANTTSGATREELLYKTMQDAIDAFSVRVDPITNREIGGEGLICLTSPLWARRIRDVIGGNRPASPGIGSYGSLDSISRVIGYEPETIVGTNETTSYTACPAGKAYLIKPNRRMIIAIKRNMQLNVNMNPNPATLAQEQKAWWFAEAMYNAGIADFIQEVTLSAW